MKRSTGPLDEIGYWTEIKLDIIAKYAAAYSTIISAQKTHFTHVYIDAFAGAGEHVARSTGEKVAGSPLRVLEIQPPFAEYHLIELDPQKTQNLRERVGDRPNVFIHEGDCNDLLIRDVFPRARKGDFRRALCLLDPYGLHLDWDVVRTAGTMQSIDMFLHFPIMDINRNVLHRDPNSVSAQDIARMNRFWGDDTWQTIAYTTGPVRGQAKLFDEFADKVPNEVIVEAFRDRLRDVAGFPEVPESIPMRNSTNAVVYYLFFASQKKVAGKIAKDIFNKYHNHGA
jgi:three-Cys-motif partner protein